VGHAAVQLAADNLEDNLGVSIFEVTLDDLELPISKHFLYEVGLSVACQQELNFGLVPAVFMSCATYKLCVVNTPGQPTREIQLFKETEDDNPYAVIPVQIIGTYSGESRTFLP